MKRSRYTEEQIASALRQAKGSSPVADICRHLGASEASFYVWKTKSGQLGLTEIRELRRASASSGCRSPVGCTSASAVRLRRCAG
jgi:hypothetical protein